MIYIRLDEMLAARGWTMYRLAESSGLSHANVWRLVRRRTTQVTFATIDAICKALQCTPGDFIVYEPEQPALPLQLPKENVDTQNTEA